MPFQGKSGYVYARQHREDQPDDEGVEVTGWGWASIGMGALVALAILGIVIAILVIVGDNKNKWKGRHGGSGVDDSEFSDAISDLEKRFHVLNDKVDWVKEDLKELDDIQEELYWMSKHMKKKRPDYYSSSSRSESESESDDPWRRERRRRKDVCPVPRGYQLRFCDPYDGTQGIYDPSTGCPYFFFADPTIPFVGDDGVIFQDFKKSFIKVDSMPFTVTVPQIPAGGVDHVKYLTYQTFPKFVEPKETLRYDIKMTCETNSGSPPFPSELITNADQDIRLASCAMNTIDFSTLMVFDWFLTGPKDGSPGIKGCFYERLPFFQNCTDPNQPECYRAFSSFNATGTRYKDDIEQLSIEYDREAGEVRWYDKGELVCRTGNLGTPNPGFVLGLDHGGNNQLVDVNQLSLGFGAFTLLDMADFLNPYSETGLVKLSNLPGFYVFPCENCFYDLQSNETSRLFGQGTKFAVFNSQASLRTTKFKYQFDLHHAPHDHPLANMVDFDYTLFFSEVPNARAAATAA